MKPVVTLAQDSTGKFAVLFAGDKRQTQTADALFYNNEALRAAGLSGEVEVALYRAPMPFRRRTANLVLAGNAPEPEATSSEKPPRGRPRKNLVAPTAG
jgi:hypothetical protein